jgi:hypothetical protein
MDMRADKIPSPTRSFCLCDFLDSLSKEATEVVGLILDAPEDLMAAFQKTSVKSSKQGMQTALKTYLQDLGWSMRQIGSSFQEIQEALAS